MNGDNDVDETEVDSSLDGMNANRVVLFVGDFYDRQKKFPSAFSARVSVANSTHSRLILRGARGQNDWMHTMIR